MKIKIKKIEENNKIMFNQNGMALLATIIFVVVLVSIGIALLSMTNNDTKMSTLQRASNKAFYLADAGIEEALWKLNTSILEKKLNIGDVETEGYIENWWSSNWLVAGTAKEYYNISVEKNGSDAEGDPIIKIVSEGIVDDAQYSSGKRKIEVTAEIDYRTETMYDYAILSDKIILFQGEPGPTIEGDVHSNDDILCSPPDGTFVNTYPGTATCSGDTNELSSNPENVGIDPKPVPEVNYTRLREKANSATPSQVITGNKILGNGESWGTESNPITGIHFIEGDLEAKNGSQIWLENGAIIVTGNIDVKEGAIFEIHNDDDYIDPADPDTALALAAQGNIKIYAKATIEKGVVQSVLADGVTTEGYIELKNGCEVTGSLIANTVYLRNKTTVNYPPSGVSEFTRKGDPFFVMTSWREI
jgi:hypothetical protein